MNHFILTITLMFSAIPSYCQTSSRKFPSGETYARQELKAALTDKQLHNVISPQKVVLDTEKKAVNFAELVLFDIYGKENIESQKPYEAVEIDGHWVISGSLPKGWKGGTFLFIVNSRDCKILRITHGK